MNQGLRVVGNRTGKGHLRILSQYQYDWAVVGQEGDRAIVIKGLRKSYGDWPVLWDLDLVVEWGQVLVVFGDNGAGKSTLLKLISTQARPEAGEVYVNGASLKRQPDRVRRAVGVVAHSDFLYEDLTCAENLAFYGRLYGLKDNSSRVEQGLSLVGLLHRRNHRVRTLSNGMQKRLSIARALLHEPSVLLLDEPEAGLDQEALGMLEGVLSDRRSRGCSAVVTTHNVDKGQLWGDKVAVLSGGRLAFPEQGCTTGMEAGGGTGEPAGGGQG